MTSILSPRHFLFTLPFFILAISAVAQTNNVAPSVGDTNLFTKVTTLRPAAVSEVNGKVDYSGGNMNSAAGNNISASITLPVSHQFGFQADALYSRISDQDFYGVAGHFFWRDPDIGLLGITGGYLYRDGFDRINTFQIGVEGQAYYKQFTFGFFAGVGSIDYQYSAPFIDTNPTRFIGRVSADYYPLENLRVGASLMTAFDNNLVKGEIEYQTPINGLAVTGEAALGDHGYDEWTLGLRFYFGGNKTLRARQRQDDPPGLMPQILQSLGLYGAEFNRKETAWLTANHISSSGGDGSYGLTITSVGSYGSYSQENSYYNTVLQLSPPPASPNMH